MIRFFVFLLILAGVDIGFAGGLHAQTATHEVTSSYELQSGDSVEITYTYTPEYNQIVVIPADGVVGLARVGFVHLGGLTLSAAKTAVTEAATKSGFNKPEVSITL